MPDALNRDSWNQHKWRKDTSWWDELEVPMEVIGDRSNQADVFDWLEEVAPDPYEHDYVLYTDGSGCTKGWGGYAAVFERIELGEEFREPVDCEAVITGTYNSTVQRSEFNAFLDGVHKILTLRCAELQEQAGADEHARYILGTEGALNQFRGPDRLTILWYTDRNNIAQCLLFDEEGDPLLPRSRERDLWLRWSFMSQHVCITPMHRPRNVVDGQALCDDLAGKARALLLEAEPSFSAASKQFHPTDTWLKKKKQVAQF